MNNATYPSGEWVGYYTYQGLPTKCPMHLTLNFVQGNVQGAGIDNNGQFVIEGSYGEATRQAEWVKRYVGKQSVKYEGAFREGDILGLWCLTEIPQGRSTPLHGEFRIWPLPAGEYPDDEPLPSILEKEIRRKK